MSRRVFDPGGYSSGFQQSNSLFLWNGYSVHKTAEATAALTRTNTLIFHIE